MVTPTTYGSSQARGHIGAIDAYAYAYAKAMPDPCPAAMPDP